MGIYITPSETQGIQWIRYQKSVFLSVLVFIQSAIEKRLSTFLNSKMWCSSVCVLEMGSGKSCCGGNRREQKMNVSELFQFPNFFLDWSCNSILNILFTFKNNFYFFYSFNVVKSFPSYFPSPQALSYTPLCPLSFGHFLKKINFCHIYMCMCLNIYIYC